jgi:hypothetical protein
MKGSVQALGRDQAQVMSGCTERRHPRTERTARVVWRGTNTDHHGADRLTAANWLRNLRVSGQAYVYQNVTMEYGCAKPARRGAASRCNWYCVPPICRTLPILE